MSLSLQKSVYKGSILAEALTSSKELLKVLGWEGPDGGLLRRELKKFQEIVGFSSHILWMVEDILKEDTVFLDCSCGKSYLAFALNRIIKELYGIEVFFYGVDTSPTLVERCKDMASSLGYENMSFWRGRSIEFSPQKPVDIVLALHACDAATDEAIAKGVRLDARYIMVVPCCQNQIRGQIKPSQPLRALTDLGLLRYRFADLLTEALRAQVLRGAGYSVELHEIVPPTVTPKNLVLTARRLRNRRKRGMEGYKELCQLLGVRSTLEGLLPELFEG
ncbi:MAG TPA: class I SAM-dependent methyltransferase [Candidatus Hypogeohydataceae bacterium YC38]|nr:SAM-dependent methyltransferase [Candidatus Brocadiales bacterium]